jgi:hypothetical protein
MLTGWSSNAQCPLNIDFVSGNFSGWQCFTGLIDPGNIMLAPCALFTSISYLAGVSSENQKDNLLQDCLFGSNVGMARFELATFPP